MGQSITSKITKMLLANSIKELLLTKPFKKITVQDITDYCQINRRTFYHHFHDIYDLIAWVVKTGILNEIDQYVGYENWQDGLMSIFMYLKNNKEISIGVFHSLDRDYIETFLYDAILSLIQPVIAKIGKKAHANERKIQFLCNFYSLAFTTIVIQWLQNNMKDDPQYIVDNLAIIIRGSLEQYLG